MQSEGRRLNDTKKNRPVNRRGCGLHRKLVEWKKLPVLKVGRKVLIKTDMLELFMEANEGRDLRERGNVKAVTRTATNEKGGS